MTTPARLVDRQVIASGVLGGLIAAGFHLAANSDRYLPLWNVCREANHWLALAAFGLVSYRLALMWFDADRWRDARALHLLAWFTWITVGLLNASLGSAYYADGATPANFTSGGRTLLNITAIALAVWWPHPTRFVPLGKGTS